MRRKNFRIENVKWAHKNFLLEIEDDYGEFTICCCSNCNVAQITERENRSISPFSQSRETFPENNIYRRWIGMDRVSSAHVGGETWNVNWQLLPGMTYFETEMLLLLNIIFCILHKYIKCMRVHAAGLFCFFETDRKKSLVVQNINFWQNIWSECFEREKIDTVRSVLRICDGPPLWRSMYGNHKETRQRKLENFSHFAVDTRAPETINARDTQLLLQWRISFSELSEF